MRKPKKPSRSYERALKPVPAITPVEYSGLQVAYDHFNKDLFGGSLPDVFIVYQRKANMRGHFAPDRYSARVGEFGRHELALNPDSFIERTDAQICSTLSHEQAHVWQKTCGTYPNRGYHNKEWAAKMKSIGLQPSSTGAVGGKETGQRVTHYILPGGPFEKAFAKLAATGWKLNLQSAPRAGSKGGTKTGKTPFRCLCGQNQWGKPDLDTWCRPCGKAALTEQFGEEAADVLAILDTKRMRADNTTQPAEPPPEPAPIESPTPKKPLKRKRPKSAKLRTKR
jgi:hypothetical protein